MERREKFKATLRAALVYPSLLMVMSMGAVAFMVTFVLPKFTRIFEQNGVNLPLPTVILLKIVSFAQEYWYIFLIAAAALFVFIYLFLSSQKGRALFDKFVLWIPVVGGIAMTVHSSVVLRTLGTLLDAGVPMLETLAVAEEGCSNRRFKKALGRLYTSVMQGEGFSAGFSGSKLFPRQIEK